VGAGVGVGVGAGSLSHPANPITATAQINIIIESHFITLLLCWLWTLNQTAW
jgi:hypothetical protein